MELSLTAIIALIGVAITILTVFAGIVGGFVRIESKSNQHAADIADIYEKMDRHTQDKEIHHDGAELNRRFGGLEDGIKEIKKEIKIGLDKISDRIDKLFEK